ncbi:MAG: hypothetical protein RI907_3853, partial [Pseudomonadota bacterium]
MALTRSVEPGRHLRAPGLVWALVFALWLGLGGCQRRALPAADTPPSSASPAAASAPAAKPTAAALVALPVAAPGPVSVGFAQDMSLHHEQALQMAELALKRASPDVRGVAEGILRQQLRELGYLQGWLMLWDASAASSEDGMPWMKQAYRASNQRDEAFERFIERCSQSPGMPGAASAAELDSLANLRGAAF